MGLQDLFAKICDCPPAKEGVASHSAQERKASVAEVPDAPEYCDSIQYCVLGARAIIRSKIFSRAASGRWCLTPVAVVLQVAQVLQVLQVPDPHQSTQFHTL